MKITERDLKIKIWCCWLAMFALIVSCTEDKITRPENEGPVIVEIIAPAIAYIAETTVVHAVVRDQQGIGDIQAVSMTLDNPAGVVHELAMRDDGLAGDIIAGDGQFVVALTAEEWQFIGAAQFVVTAVDNSAETAVSDTVTLEVLPGSRGAIPRVLGIDFADSIRIDSTYDVQILATVDDDDGLATIDSVLAAFYQTIAASPDFIVQLRDDGQNDDGLAGNGRFGAKIVSSASGFSRANYVLRVLAIDKKGNRSAARSRSFVTTKLGEIAPEITAITVPDTISRSGGEPIVLKAQVDDRNGLNDIRRVIFNTFRPDGTPSSGNPFSMRADGIKDAQDFGDETAGDGEYTMVISITANNATGNYRFEFQSEDKAGLKSEKVNHILTVIE